jgi:hypothetical protein
MPQKINIEFPKWEICFFRAMTGGEKLLRRRGFMQIMAGARFDYAGNAVSGGFASA